MPKNKLDAADVFAKKLISVRRKREDDYVRDLYKFREMDALVEPLHTALVVLSKKYSQLHVEPSLSGMFTFRWTARFTRVVTNFRVWCTPENKLCFGYYDRAWNSSSERIPDSQTIEELVDVVMTRIAELAVKEEGV
jgi:hypothetical protein